MDIIRETPMTRPLRRMHKLWPLDRLSGAKTLAPVSMMVPGRVYANHKTPSAFENVRTSHCPTDAGLCQGPRTVSETLTPHFLGGLAFDVLATSHSLLLQALCSSILEIGVELKTLTPRDKTTPS